MEIAVKLTVSCGILLLLGCYVVRPAMADVYGYVDGEGTTYLSNVPSDQRYQVLVSEERPSNVSVLRRTERRLATPGTMAAKAGYQDMVEQVAKSNGLEAALLHAVISVESHYNAQAVSKKGAAGLMQLMPATARRYGVADAFDPVQNVQGGAKYLRDLLAMFNSDIGLALAAYNAGENAVMRYGNRIPPFRETKDYVPRVLGFYRKYQAEL